MGTCLYERLLGLPQVQVQGALQAQQQVGSAPRLWAKCGGPQGALMRSCVRGNPKRRAESNGLRWGWRQPCARSGPQDMRTSTAACMHRRQSQQVAGTSMAHVLMQRSDKTTQGNAGVILTPINVVQGSLVREHTGIDLLYFPCVAGEWLSAIVLQHTITTRATSTIHSVTIHPHMAPDCRTATCTCTLRSLTTAPAAQY